MTPRSAPSRTIRPGRWLCLAVAIAFGPGSGWAIASSASSAGRLEHDHLCKCRVHCRGGSCCCGPREKAAKASRPTTAATATASVEVDGPCLDSSPCGDPAAPEGAPAGPLGKAGTLATIGRLAPDSSGRLRALRGRCLLPARRASRLDDPPESPRLA